jgi:hypothetical protein
MSDNIIKYFVTLNCFLVLGLNALNYGLWNLCYFCDISLLLTTLTFWVQFNYRSLLSSISVLLAFLPSIVWTIDFILLSIDISLFGMADYMFNPSYHIIMRFLSTFHVWLWIVHLYLIKKYTYSWIALNFWLFIIFIVYFSLETFQPIKPKNINSYEKYHYKYILIIINYCLHRLFFLIF